MSVTFLTNEDPILRYDEQNLTLEQQAQARENLGLDSGEIPETQEFYTSLDGALRTNGTFASTLNSYHTDYIPLDGYARLYARARIGQMYYFVAFFDSSRNLMHDVSVIGADPNTYQTVDMRIPEGAAYCMVTHYSPDATKQGYLRLQVVDYDSSLCDKKINTLGDSITSDKYTVPTWGQIIADRTGSTFNNYGVSGTRIAVSADRTDSFVERMTGMDTNADAVVVMGGTNDNTTTRGAWNSTDNTTFFGALNALLSGLCENYAGKPIIFCTPIQQSVYVDNNNFVQKPVDVLMSKAETDTLSMQLRAEAIKLKCAQYGIPCLDLYNSSGINGADANNVYYRESDNLHPSEVGQNRLANLIQRELERFFA